MMSEEDVKKVYEETQCSSIEEFVIEFGENSKEFSLMLQDLLKTNKKTTDILILLRELWVEINVLHKIAVFLKQCFADPISKANLTDAKDKKSKFARSILMIDIMEA